MSFDPTSPDKFPEGALVWVVDDAGTPMGTALFLCTVVPALDGITYEELRDQQDIVQHASGRSDPIFYAIPTVWHFRIIMSGRVVHLNTSFFALLPIIEDNEVSQVQS